MRAQPVRAMLLLDCAPTRCVSRGGVSTRLQFRELLEDELLIQTSWKSALCGVLVLGWVAACSGTETGSNKSSSTSTDIEHLRDAAADASASNDASAADSSSADSAAEDSAVADASAADAGSQDPQPTAAGHGGGSGAARNARSEPWRIVLLGDSITEQTCTSQLLWQNLNESGAKSFDLVGTRHSEQDCGVEGADRDNEGHSGYRATDMVDDGPHAAELSAWCSADKSDVVLMHLGTNDISQASLPTATILSSFSKILKSLRAVQPKVTVFVAQIIPMNVGNCNDCPTEVHDLNQQIPAWAASESHKDSPVYVVDQHSGFDTTQDTRDGVHPNPQGSKKMADKWSAALRQRLKL
jgi:acyl-CoA thioesterase-1